MSKTLEKCGGPGSGVPGPCPSSSSRSKEEREFAYDQLGLYSPSGLMGVPFPVNPIGKELIKAAKGVVSRVTTTPLSGLIATQQDGKVSVKGVRNFVDIFTGKSKADLSDADPAYIVQKNGVRYILDGHTRATALKLMGRNSIEAEFVNLDVAAAKRKVALYAMKATTSVLRLEEKRLTRKFIRDRAMKIHEAQSKDLEEALTAALAPMFKEQIESAASKIAAGAKKVFDPKEWDKELINRALPPIAVATARAMYAQVLQMKEDAILARKSFKASTATEWLDSLDDDDAPDLEDVVFSTPYGNVTLKLATEYPQWMKDSIQERLNETFSQDYWKEINQTTGGDIDGFLSRGLRDGLSVEEMARTMRAEYGEEYPLYRGRNIARTECLPGATVVDAANIVSVFRRQYSGPWIEIVTKAGRKISGTPNHPVLTLRGWVGLGELQEFDSLVCNTAGIKNPGVSVDPDIEKLPATSIEDIFNSLSNVGVCERRATRNVDFHGDGVDGYVDVLRPNGELSYGNLTPIEKAGVNFIFSEADVSNLLLVAKGNTLPQRVCQHSGLPIPTDSSPVLSDYPDNTGGVGSNRFGYRETGFAGSVPKENFILKRQKFVVTPETGGQKQTSSFLQISHRHPGHFNDIGDSGPVTVEDFSDLGSAHSRDIEIDHLLFVRRIESHTCHVFNLSTKEGYYSIAGGVYTRNCSNALNGARSAAIDGLIDDLGIKDSVKKTWLSVLGNTTRDTHAHLDGVPAGSDGCWALGGVRARWPGDTRLPAKERCNCQCTVVSEYGMQNDEARELIAEYDLRVAKKGYSPLDVKGEYSCVLAVVYDDDVLKQINKVKRLIDPEDLVEMDDQPHVTVLYGLHTQEPFSVRRVLSDYAGTIHATIGKLSLFENEKADVLKFSIESTDMAALHELLKTLPYTSDFPKYVPHMTVAYLKPGTGKDYFFTTGLEGTRLDFDALVFSTKDRVQTEIPLNMVGAGKTFCPTGPGGGINPHCGSGGSGTSTIGKKLGVDVSSWNPKVADAKWTLKYLAKLEELAEKGDFTTGLVHIAGPNKPWLSKVYAKALEVAKEEFKKKAVASINAPIEAKTTEAKPVWKKIGGQLGTEEGGLYEYGGKKYYVKTPENLERAKNEVLALKLYALAGASAKDGNLVEMNGKTVLATDWHDDITPSKWGAKEKADAAGDFAVHAWLNNWDAAGANKENIQIKDGKPFLLDAGGSLEYSAHGGGGKKNFTDAPVEWTTLRDPNVNPNMAAIFGGMTAQQLADSAKKVAAISDDDIRGMVKIHGNGDAVAKEVMIEKLIHRRDLIKGFGKLYEGIAENDKGKEAAAAAQLSSPQPTHKDKQPGAPSIPPPPNLLYTEAKKKDPFFISYQQKFNDIYQAAQNGHAKYIDAIKVKPDAKDPTVKKLFAYKQQALQALGMGGTTNTDHVIPAPVKKGPVKIDPAQLPSIPEFVSSNAANTAMNKKAAETAFEMAKLGDLAGLQAITSVLPPSPKLKEWHSKLVNNVSNQLNLPPPPKPPQELEPLLSTYQKHAGSISIKQKAGLEKLGYWSVMGIVPAVQAGTVNGTWKINNDDLHSAGMAAAKKGGFLTVAKEYTDSAYDYMNDSLRNGAPSSDALKLAKGIMDYGITLPVGQMLSRKHDGVEGATWAKAVPGSVIAERGVLSTSTDPKVWHGSTHLHLTIGPGVKGIPANDFSYHDDEKEVLLPSNQRILVTKVENDGGITKVHGVILPTEPTQCCPP